MELFKRWNKKKKKSVKYPELNPNKIIFPDSLTLDDIKNILGRKWSSVIESLQPLFKFIDKNMYTSVVNISQTASPLVSAYKGQSHVNRAIKKLKDIQVLKVVCQQFKNNEYGMTYTVNDNNLYLLYAKEDIINNYTTSIPHSNITLQDMKEKDKMRIRLGNVSLSDDLNDFTINTELANKYPQILDYQWIVRELNSVCLEKDLGDYVIKFEPTITRSKNGKVKKIGIRATSPFMSRKSRKKHPELPWYFKCREDYLDEDLGTGWTEYDVKGSVPRIAHLIQTGEWLDANEDPYKIMFEPICTEGWSNEWREVFKDWFMRVYFGRSVQDIVRNAIWSEDYPEITNDNKEEITKGVIEMEQQINEFCGKHFRDTSIFLHESCIYLNVRWELLKRGLDVKQVYDGFYFKKGEQPKDMDDIIKNAALDYYRTYINK